jgi:hypothetical protein
VAFLDDDDLWLRHRLSAQVAALEEAQEVEVAYSQHAVLLQDGSVSGVMPGPEAPSGSVFEPAVKEARLAHVNTILVPREAVENIGGFDEGPSLVI